MSRRAIGLLAGLAFGLVAGITLGLVAGLEGDLGHGVVVSFAGGPAGGLVFVAGLIFGIVAGITLGLVAGLGSAATPARAMRIRVRGLVAGIAAGLVFGLEGGAVGGIPVGIAAGIVAGLAFGIVAGLAGVPGDLAGVTSPWTVLALDRRVALQLVLMAGLAVGVAFGLAGGLAVGLGAGLVAGCGLSMRGTTWPSYMLTTGWLALRHRLPWSLMSFLADAHQRGVLRQAGAVYQFRHLELQRRLAARPIRTTPGPGGLSGLSARDWLRTSRSTGLRIP